MKNILSLLIILVCLAQCGVAAGKVKPEQHNGWRTQFEGNGWVLYVENDSAWTDIKEYFAHEEIMKKRTYRVVIEEGVTEVSDSALSDWYLTEISLSQAKGLKRIGKYAFFRGDDGENDASATFPDEFAFPEGLEYIGDNAFGRRGSSSSFNYFRGCHVTFPKSLKYIGRDAFRGAGMDSVTFSKGLEYIGLSAFYGNNFDSVKLPDGLKEVHCAFIISSVEIPEGMEYYTFRGSFDLKSVKFPQNDTWIPRDAFTGCVDLYRSEGQTDRLVLPDGIRIIGQRAFCGCTALKYIVLPASVDTVEKESFYQITGKSGNNNFRVDCYAVEPPGMRAYIEGWKNPYSQWANVKGGDAMTDLYVPAESVEKYKASQWAKEFNIYALDPKDNPYTAIRDVEGNKLKVSVRGGVVSVEGVDEFDVYDMSGRKMPAGRPLPAGVYVVTTGTGSERVVVK